MISRFTPVNAFTSAVTFGSNPLGFSLDGGLKSPPRPPPNPDDENDDGGRLLLLLFPEGGLLLLLFLKALNPPNGFTPTVSKYEKCPPSVFTLLVAFC